MAFTLRKFVPANRVGTNLPAPANFQTFNEFAGYMALRNVRKSSVPGSNRPITEAALAYLPATQLVVDGIPAFFPVVYVQGVWLGSAPFFWGLAYPGNYPRLNMGATMTLPEATERGYIWGMHLLMPDVFAAGGGTWPGMFQ